MQHDMENTSAYSHYEMYDIGILRGVKIMKQILEAPLHRGSCQGMHKYIPCNRTRTIDCLFLHSLGTIAYVETATVTEKGVEIVGPSKLKTQWSCWASGASPRTSEVSAWSCGLRQF